MYNKKILFLIDAYPIIYQGFYAMKKNPLITSSGINTSPIVNFTFFLIKILNKYNPNYMAVIFDGEKKTFRKNKYKKYKLNRKKTPKDIFISISYIIKILKSLNIHFVHSANGYEADDIIGTFSKIAENKGYTVFIVSLDKDFLQLVTKNIKIFKPPFKKNPKEIIGIEDVKKKYGVNHPKQIIDLWSMMGDKSDNIPGIPGIGEKFAKKFIKKYGDIEKLLKSIDELNGKLKEKIEKNKKLGFLSKELITIKTNVPNIYFDKNIFSIKNPCWKSIKKIFKKLEIKKFLFSKVYQYCMYKMYNKNIIS